jgi:hypothetical protein
VTQCSQGPVITPIHATMFISVTRPDQTVFARSNTGIVGSNRTQGMDVCVRLLCVCVVLCVGSGLATG